MTEVNTVIAGRHAACAFAPITDAYSVAFLHIHAVDTYECAVHLDAGVSFIVVAALLISNIRQASAFHLGHNQIENRVTLCGPLRVGVVCIINLVKQVSHLLHTGADATHIARRRPGSRIRSSIACFNVKLDNCAVRLSGHINAVDTIISVTVTVCPVIKHHQVVVVAGVVIWVDIFAKILRVVNAIMQRYRDTGG
ncbi:hypothetical protein ES703_08524 [subsurface metagenome]